MIPLPLPAPREILVLKADRLCAGILRQTASRIFPSAAVRVTNSLGEAKSALKIHPVDLLLTGIVLFDGDALELLASCPNSRGFRSVLVVSGRREHRILTMFRELSVDGVFDPMDDDLAKLEIAIYRVGTGGSYWSDTVQARVAKKNASSASICRLLSPTEQLVFAVIGDGSDNVVAGDRLNLKPSTIHSVRREIHRKLGIQHKGELMRLAVQEGFVRFTADGVERPGFSKLVAACGKKLAV